MCKGITTCAYLCNQPSIFFGCSAPLKAPNRKESGSWNAIQHHKSEYTRSCAACQVFLVLRLSCRCCADALQHFAQHALRAGAPKHATAGLGSGP